MLAIILTSPLHSLQVSISILKTRFNRFAQVIEAFFSAGVWSDSFGDLVFMHLPRLDGVTRARYLLLGAKTPWKRVRLTLGLGTKATSLEIKSSGSNITWVVPLCQGVRLKAPTFGSTHSGSGHCESTTGVSWILPAS